ncbi:TetR/AcrR family transcriptional regulator [Nocardiopsis sp. FIRDI 009]|uniref:TetR/AcrR family transcriptional regulator n=1 Tax=Nocardiopsis sp. FIRDI 009 TaxID=714197 RepID=UPI000E2373A8|nr:TetR/AcrR family transcriptional regulator [Nocardiopsis sp. FIRDI 009]
MTRTETTRALLLNAARREFTAHGISGARVDRIAERAGVNKQRIYAYFGSKEKLFERVIEGARQELAEVVSLDDTGPAEYVRHVHEYHRDHPDLLRLLLWESLYYGDRRLPGEDERAPAYARKVEQLAEALGEPPSDRTRRTLLLLIGIAALPNMLPQLSRMVLGTDPGDPEAERALADFLAEFVDAALGADGRG